MSRLRIGQVAERTGLSVEAIRYYEQRGLLEPPARTASGYREYPESVLARLAFIDRGKDLGFSLEEIRELLALELTPGADSGAVKALVEEKVALIDDKLHQLGRLRDSLQRLSSLCDGAGTAQHCPILAFLKQGEAAEAGRPRCASERAISAR